jgi:hypothetical protein
MQRRTWILLAAAIAAGCGRSNHEPPAASDPSEARQALIAALDAWKSGVTISSLKERIPPIIVADEDWSRGDALAAYALQGDGIPFGNRVRFNVVLDVKGAAGPARKQALFIVATNPAITISRSDHHAE